MTFDLLSRIRAPAAARRGEVFSVRVTLAHPMETGFRYDEHGRQTPYNVINTFACSYNGAPVFTAALSSGIAANPGFEFFIRARDFEENFSAIAHRWKRVAIDHDRGRIAAGVTHLSRDLGRG